MNQADAARKTLAFAALLLGTAAPVNWAERDTLSPSGDVISFAKRDCEMNWPYTSK